MTRSSVTPPGPRLEPRPPPADRAPARPGSRASVRRPLPQGLHPDAADQLAPGAVLQPQQAPVERPGALDQLPPSFEAAALQQRVEEPAVLQPAHVAVP